MESRDPRPVMERNTRDGIIDTALRLLEETGLPDLSMRRLASALGVQPSALYWHFENKQSLLAAVAARIVGAAEPAPATGESKLAFHNCSSASCSSEVRLLSGMAPTVSPVVGAGSLPRGIS